MAATTGRFVNRGFLHGPVCPIYGVGAVIVTSVLRPPYFDNVFVLFLGAVVLASVLEWLTGFVLEKLFHEKWWNYKNEPYNISGYICLKFSIIWGVCCVLVVRGIQPLLMGAVQLLPKTLGWVILAEALLLMAADLFLTLHKLLLLHHFLRARAGLQSSLNEAAEGLVRPLEAAAEGLGRRIFEGTEAVAELRREAAVRPIATRLARAFPRLSVISGAAEVRLLPAARDPLPAGAAFAAVGAALLAPLWLGWGTAVFSLPVAALLIWMLAATRYELWPNVLYCRSGPFRRSVLYEQICDVSPCAGRLGLFAFSKNQLSVSLKNGRSLSVAAYENSLLCTELLCRAQRRRAELGEEVLAEAAHKLCKEEVRFAVGASRLLMQMGIADTLQEIELIVDRQSLDKADRVLSSMGKKHLRESKGEGEAEGACGGTGSGKSEGEYFAEQLYEYEVRGTEIKLMCGFGVCQNGAEWHLRFDEGAVQTLGGLPFCRAEDWYLAYLMMGRTERAGALCSYFAMTPPTAPERLQAPYTNGLSKTAAAAAAEVTDPAHIWVTPALMRDAEAIAGLSQAVLGFAVTAEQTKEHMKKIAENPNECLLIARRAGRAVGYIHGGEYECLLCDTVCVVKALAVAENARRQGAGKALFCAMEAFAKEKGWAGLRIYAGEESMAANSFYTALSCRYDTADKAFHKWF